MRVCLNTWGYPTDYSKSLNGIAVYTARTAKALVQLGHQVTVITSHADGMPDHYEQDGISIFQARPGNIHWYMYKLKFPKEYITLVKLYDIGHSLVKMTEKLHTTEKFDIVEIGPPSNFYFPYLQKDYSPNVVTTIHGMSIDNQTKKDTLTQRLGRYIEKRSAELSRCLVAPSQFVAETYQHIYKVLPKVIPHPVEVEGTAIRLKNLIKVVTLAGIGSGKGSDIFLSYIPEILTHHPNVEVTIIAGEGKKDFQLLAEEFGLTGQVKLLPWLPLERLHDLYRQSHIFISASRFETFSLAAAEAMAAGMAVLLSDIPPHYELIGKNERGMIFQLNNPFTINQALFELINQSSLRIHLSEVARKWALSNLDPIIVTQKRVELYQSLVYENSSLS